MSSLPLWRHLKERKIVQWALAYLGGAWLILQVLDLLAQPFAWPDLVIRAATVLLGIGFLAALVLAWYHGERGAQRVSSVELLMLAGILVIAAASVAVVSRGGRAGADGRPVAGTAPAPVADARSIAVLPFVDLSPERDQEYFGDGMAEELLNALAQLDDLKVAARTSAFSFKGRNLPVQQIARELGVATVLEGSIRKSALQELAPGFFYFESPAALAHRAQGRYAEALAVYRRAEEALGYPPYGLGVTYARMGRPEEARRVARALEARAGSAYVGKDQIALIYAALGEEERAMDWLERAYEERSAWVVWHRWGPDVQPIRGHPRYLRLMQRVERR